MNQSNDIQSLEEQLAQAKRNSEPVIITEERSKDQVVYTNHTHGSVRVDLVSAPVPVERPVVKPEVAMVDRPIDPEVGKVVKETATERIIKLAGGTRRTDLK